jgi:hypothetical protein
MCLDDHGSEHRLTGDSDEPPIAADRQTVAATRIRTERDTRTTTVSAACSRQIGSDAAPDGRDLQPARGRYEAGSALARALGVRSHRLAPARGGPSGPRATRVLSKSAWDRRLGP